MHHIKHAGFTLIEILISLTLSSIIFAALIESYLSNLYCYRLQHAFIAIQTNGIRASHLFQSNDIREFYIAKTKRHYPNGAAIYSLYQKNNEIIAGVKALHYELLKTGFLIELLLTEPPIEKKWYVFAPFK